MVRFIYLLFYLYVSPLGESSAVSKHGINLIKEMKEMTYFYPTVPGNLFSSSWQPAT